MKRAIFSLRVPHEKKSVATARQARYAMVYFEKPRGIVQRSSQQKAAGKKSKQNSACRRTGAAR
jgi:hypothetical protein